MSSKRKAIGYACLNTLSQQPENMSLFDQEKIIRTYAEENGIELIHIYHEVVSASKGGSRQPLLNKIINEMPETEATALIVARLDRLTRDIRSLNKIVSNLCMKNKIELHCIKEGLNTQSKSGELVIDIINIFDKWDSKRMSDQTREIIARKRAKGERVGHAPFGFTYKNKQLVEVKEEMSVVAIIRTKCTEGKSYHWIARHLNDAGINSKRGGIWYAETVKAVYNNSLKNNILRPEHYISAGLEAPDNLL